MHQRPGTPDLDPVAREAAATTLLALYGSRSPGRRALALRADEAAAARLALPLPAPQLLAATRDAVLAAVAAVDAGDLGERVRAYYAGEPVLATSAWSAAVQLLWRHRLPRARLVVYTALVGAKEALADPLQDLPPGAASDLELDFVCITDDPALSSPVWRTRVIPGGHLPPEKLSRRPKALPHEYFPDAEFSLYIDNTVRFRRLPQASDLATGQGYLFKAFRHATRHNPQQEAAAVAALGYDDIGTICNQMAFYAARGPLDEITPLTTATVLLREHHRDEVRRFGITWWESILAFSKRDQLSFDFARRLAGCSVEYFAGGTHDNDFIVWQGSLAQHRVKASFDERRYAWLHRDDPEAGRDPRGHFLRHHRGGSDAAYQRANPLLEYVCLMQGSSLGRQVSPRRGVAETLQALLEPQREAGGRWLLLRVQDSPLPQAFGRDEHDAAAKALSMFLGGARGTLIDVSAAELDGDGKVYAGAAAFETVVALGPGAAQLGRLLQRVQRLLAPGGRLVAVLAGSATLADAAAAEAALAAALGATVQATLHAARHDDERGPLAHGLLALHWQPAAPAAAAAAATATDGLVADA